MIRRLYGIVRRVSERASYRIYSGKDRQRKHFEKAREWLLRVSGDRRSREAKSAKEKSMEIPESGFCVLPENFLEDAPEVVVKARKLFEILDPDDAEDTSTKQHLLYPHLPDNEIVAGSPFFKMALNEKILKIVSSYLGTVPILYRVSLMYSRPVPGASYDSSQLYHCDWDSVSQVKMFLHVNDIDEQGGPLVVMDARDSEKVRSELGYIYRSRKTRGGKQAGPRLSDDQVNSIADEKSIFPITGAAGTVSLVDTSRCLHYGSRISDTKPERMIVLFWYLKRSSFRFPLWSRSMFPYKNLQGDLSPLQKMAIGKA